MDELSAAALIEQLWVARVSVYQLDVKVVSISKFLDQLLHWDSTHTICTVKHQLSFVVLCVLVCQSQKVDEVLLESLS